MKKTISLLLALALCATLLAGCSGPASSAASSAPAQSAASESQPQQAAQRTAFRIASLKGPTTMGLVGLMDSADKGEARHDYEVTMYGAADEITPLLVKGEVDVALVPCNLASVLYNKMKETGGVEVAAINTLGVLYIVTTGDDITSVADLAGKTIYSTGKGTTPEYTLNYILEQNGLVPGEDVTVEYKSEATEVLSAMQMSSGYPIAMLPQPYVTTAQMQMEGLSVALDMTEEWNKVSPDSALVTGVVLARTQFVERGGLCRVSGRLCGQCRVCKRQHAGGRGPCGAVWHCAQGRGGRKGPARVQYHVYYRGGYEGQGVRLFECSV